MRRFSATATLSIMLWLLPAQAVPPTVGIEGRIEVSVPGGLLVPRSLDPKSRVVIRVANAQPDGSGFRYDLRYSGLVPGTYNLSDYLAREGTMATNGLPRIPVTVLRVLPEQHDGTIADEGPASLARSFPYRIAIAAIVALWALLLIPLIFAGRKKKPAPVAPPPPLPTLADVLRPLVEKAVEGTMEPADLARLEHLLLEFWRRKLGVAKIEHASALAQLRKHPEAGVLLSSLESWLYKPPGRNAVDIHALLEPYRTAPCDSAFDEAAS